MSYVPASISGISTEGAAGNGPPVASLRAAPSPAAAGEGALTPGSITSAVVVLSGQCYALTLTVTLGSPLLWPRERRRLRAKRGEGRKPSLHPNDPDMQVPQLARIHHRR